MISAKQAREITKGKDRFTIIMENIRTAAIKGEYKLLVPTEEMTSECEEVLNTLGYNVVLLGHEGYEINWEYKGYKSKE